MTDAPGAVDNTQLQELNIRLKAKPKKEESSESE